MLAEDLEQDRLKGKKVAVRKNATGDIFTYIGVLEKSQTDEKGNPYLVRDVAFIRSDGLVETASTVLDKSKASMPLEGYTRLYTDPPDFSHPSDKFAVTDVSTLIKGIGYLIEPVSLQVLFKETNTVGMPLPKVKDSHFILTHVEVGGDWEKPRADRQLVLTFLGESESVYRVDLSKSNTAKVKKLKIATSSMFASVFVPEVIGRKEKLSPMEDD